MNPRDALAKGGLAAAACVACCAPPLVLGLGFTAGIAAAAAVFLGIAVSIAVVMIGGSALFAHRRSRQSTPAGPSVPVSIIRPQHGQGRTEQSAGYEDVRVDAKRA